MQDDRIRIVREEVLSDHFSPLTNVVYEQRRSDGQWQELSHEVYNAASGAAILLYNRERRTLLLTRQFRMGALKAGHRDGFLLEVPAGVLDGAEPEERVRAEVREECGYDVGRVDKVATLFASPSCLTEQVHYFVGEYDASQRCGEGGGKEEEGEDIEVLEIGIDEAFAKMDAGEIVDTKTVVLLQHLRLQLMRPSGRPGNTVSDFPDKEPRAD